MKNKTSLLYVSRALRYTSPENYRHSVSESIKQNIQGAQIYDQNKSDKAFMHTIKRRLFKDPLFLKRFLLGENLNYTRSDDRFEADTFKKWVKVLAHPQYVGSAANDTKANSLLSFMCVSFTARGRAEFAAQAMNLVLPIGSKMGKNTTSHIHRLNSNVVFGELLTRIGLVYLELKGNFFADEHVVMTVVGVLALKVDTVSTQWGVYRKDDLCQLQSPLSIKKIKPIDGVTYIPLSMFDKYGVANINGEWTTKEILYKRPLVNVTLRSHGGSKGVVKYLHKRTLGLRLGLEWELNAPPGKNVNGLGVKVANMVNEFTQSDYFSVEYDSSVPNGFEVVTSNMASTEHKAKLAAMHKRYSTKTSRIDPFKRCGPPTTNTGCHIHIDRRNIDNWKALSYFMNTLGNTVDGIDFTIKLFGRAPNRWCRTTTINNPDKGGDHPTDRFVPCNLENKATIEIRAFSSPTGPKGMIGNIEVVEALVEWTNQIVSVNPKRLTPANFTQFVLKNVDKYPLVRDRIAPVPFVYEVPISHALEVAVLEANDDILFHSLFGNPREVAAS